MDDLPFAYGTGAIIVGYFFAQVVSRRFDPFAPIWLFLVGYVQVYVLQAISYHSWGVSVRGQSLVAAADFRALWALVWFLAVYHLCPARGLASLLARPPRSWSPAMVALATPPLALWGLYCSAVVIRNQTDEVISPELVLFRSFPFVLMVAAILLIVTGRNIRVSRPAFTVAGLGLAFGYVMMWMFNGKRSHSLIAVLATVCAFYITRLRRPSWPMLFTTAFSGALVVAIAITWRNDLDHERSLAGFASFLADFRVSRILESLVAPDDGEELLTHETEEYGGFLLMMDTVPHKSDFDYGANYLRVFSTFIPRMIWRDKPLFGRRAWVNAWIAGSEMPRDEDFSSPAIGLLGATQLNGGAVGTLIVLAAIALVLRTAYEYFRLHPDVPWVQFWWAISYYNAWFMVVNDDPLVWFYYNWGFTTFPFVLLFWWVNRFGSRRAAVGELAPAM